MSKKRELSALELGLMAKDLQILVGAKLQQVYQQDKKDFIFELHVSGQGKKMIRVLFPTYIFLTERKLAQEEPTAFCQALRNHLVNKRVISVKQHSSERILVFDFGEVQLIFELFGGGNLLVVKGGVAQLVFEAREWKDRAIKKGVKYDFPKSLDLYALDKPSFDALVDANPFDSMVKFFALSLSLGGMFAEELCLRAKIDKTKKSLTDAEKASSFQALRSLLQENSEPYMIDQDVAPFLLELHVGKDKAALPSLSAAFEYLSTVQVVEKTAQDKERERLLVIKEQQLESLHKLEVQVAESTRKGELIFENYTVVSEVLSGLKEALVSKDQSKFLALVKANPLIKSYDLKEKKVVLNLE
jgi:predicted ribosome quality control (RQC) complex YloA/Tae2 family protein